MMLVLLDRGGNSLLPLAFIALDHLGLSGEAVCMSNKQGCWLREAKFGSLLTDQYNQ